MGFQNLLGFPDIQSLLFTSKLNIIGITVHNYGRHDNNKSYDNSKFNGFSCVCQMETLGTKGLIYSVHIITVLGIRAVAKLSVVVGGKEGAIENTFKF